MQGNRQQERDAQSPGLDARQERCRETEELAAERSRYRQRLAPARVPYIARPTPSTSVHLAASEAAGVSKSTPAAKLAPGDPSRLACTHAGFSVTHSLLPLEDLAIDGI